MAGVKADYETYSVEWQLTKLFAAQINRDYPIFAKLAVLLFVGLIFYIYSLATRRNRLQKSLRIPVLKAPKSQRISLLRAIREGQRKYPDTPYILDANELEYVVFPPAMFDEIKRLPENDASFQEFARGITHGYFGTETDALCKTVAVDLARSIPLKIPTQQKDARISFDMYVGYCPDYKSLPLFDTVTKVVGSVNASSFAGRNLGGSDWPKAIQWLLKTTIFADKLLTWVPKSLQPLIRPFVFLPAFTAERGLRKRLAPIVRRDMDEYERAASRKEILKSTEDGKVPFTQWLMARYEGSSTTQYKLATDQLIVNTESVLKMSLVLYNIIFELARQPQLQAELRREIDEVSLLDGQLPLSNLKELRKMDSVMRETARVHPISPFTLCRKTRQPLQLSHGPLLPTGTVLCVDSDKINTSVSNPDDFDPYRFLNMREKGSTEHTFQFVSTGPSDPNWGDGTQACPGRFFANSTLKVCLTHLLMNYDMKLGRKHQQADGAFTVNGIFTPDTKVYVSFQSRD